MRRAVALIAAVALPALFAAPARATTTVDAVNYAFSPVSVTVPMGSTVSWHNTTSATTHTSTQDQGVWDTGNITHGNTKGTTIKWAASYVYHCTFHPTLMIAVVKVPIQVSPSTGTTSTTFTITFATAALPAGYTVTVQERVGLNSWMVYQSGLTGMTTTFHPSSAGTYAFRSLLVRTSDGMKTKPSPKRKISVS